MCLCARVYNYESSPNKKSTKIEFIDRYSIRSIYIIINISRILRPNLFEFKFDAFKACFI